MRKAYKALQEHKAYKDQQATMVQLELKESLVLPVHKVQLAFKVRRAMMAW